MKYIFPFLFLLLAVSCRSSKSSLLESHCVAASESISIKDLDEMSSLVAQWEFDSIFYCPSLDSIAESDFKQMQRNLGQNSKKSFFPIKGKIQISKSSAKKAIKVDSSKMRQNIISNETKEKANKPYPAPWHYMWVIVICVCVNIICFCVKIYVSRKNNL